MADLEPRDVFVPNGFPVGDTNVFADRGLAQADLQKAMDRGFVPLVYGSYGVGKSSLVLRAALPWKAKNNQVYVESVHGKSLSDIFAALLEHLGYEIVVNKVSSSNRGGSGELSGEVEGGIIMMLKAKLASTIKREWAKEDSVEKELAVSSPTDSRIVRLCDAAGLLLIIDELHRGTPEFTRDLAAFVKAYANSNCRSFRICLLGTENDPNRLVLSDPGIGRTLDEIQLKPITQSEARAIIEPGMKALGISIPEALVSATVQAGVGSPFIVQYLCLEMAERVRRDARTVLVKSDLDDAIADYARRKAQQSILRYKAAIETTGPKRYRKQVLHAMAEIEDEYVTMDALVERVSARVGEDTPSTALSGPLRQLKSKEYAEILRDVDHPGKDGRVFNYSSFSDPAMKSTIRMIASINVDNLVK
ncbi:MAG: KAP family NTPase [Planctomycetes bacterium]|nr:KAP family NTPase [Planctomycetota bacterium]